MRSRQRKARAAPVGQCTAPRRMWPGAATIHHRFQPPLRGTAHLPRPRPRRPLGGAGAGPSNTCGRQGGRGAWASLYSAMCGAGVGDDDGRWRQAEPRPLETPPRRRSRRRREERAPRRLALRPAPTRRRAALCGAHPVPSLRVEKTYPRRRPWNAGAGTNAAAAVAAFASALDLASCTMRWMAASSTCGDLKTCSGSRSAARAARSMGSTGALGGHVFGRAVSAHSCMAPLPGYWAACLAACCLHCIAGAPQSGARHAPRRARRWRLRRRRHGAGCRSRPWLLLRYVSISCCTPTRCCGVAVGVSAIKTAQLCSAINQIGEQITVPFVANGYRITSD